MQSIHFQDGTDVNKGDLLPEFLLMDLNGNVVSSNNYQGKTAIYLFYRGNWCPLCMAQVKELVRYYKQLEKRGVSTVLISPQPQSHSQSLADKYDVSFDFMVDKDNLAAEKLGISRTTLWRELKANNQPAS